MAALISVFIAITLSLLITRIATEALILTGLSRTSVSFQARSAFTGSGFTTAESEAVVKHPLRRRIIMWLMFLGNAGIITVISSLVLTFVSTSSIQNGLSRLLYLFCGLAVLWLFATNKAFNRILTRLVKKALRRWTDLDLRDYASLLHLRGEYQVMEIEVDDDTAVCRFKRDSNNSGQTSYANAEDLLDTSLFLSADRAFGSFWERTASEKPLMRTHSPPSLAFGNTMARPRRSATTRGCPAPAPTGASHPSRLTAQHPKGAKFLRNDGALAPLRECAVGRVRTHSLRYALHHQCSIGLNWARIRRQV